MNITKQLITPDHNFSPGSRHYLIPYCYKVFSFKENYLPGNSDTISHHGGLKIVLRAAYWHKEHAYHTAIDLEEMLLEERYFQWTRIPTINEAGDTVYLKENMKPILFLRSDNASNYSPRYEKVQHVMFYLFKLSYHICM